MSKGRRELDLSRVDVSRFETEEDDAEPVQEDVEVEDLTRPDTPPEPSVPPSERPIHPVVFALGVVALLAGAVLVGASLGGTWYTVEARDGPQPDLEGDADGTIRFHYTVRMDTFERVVADADGRAVDTETSEIEAAPYVALALQRLQVSLVLGIVLAGLGLVAVVLHRLDVLAARGFAPVATGLAAVVWTLGLGLTAAELAHHARLQWISGRLDVDVAFLTFNADGTRVHDLTMLPGMGYWMAVAGAVVLVIGGLLLHARDVRVAVRELRSAAQAAATDASGTDQLARPSTALDDDVQEDGADVRQAT